MIRLKSQMEVHWSPWRGDLPLGQQTTRARYSKPSIRVTPSLWPSACTVIRGSTNAGPTEADVQPGHAVTLSNVNSCTWVRRGKDWIWGDQDGGEVDKLVGWPYRETFPNGGYKSRNEGWHRVKWTATGITALYRIGAEDCYDLEAATKSPKPQRRQLRSNRITSSNPAAIYPQWASKQLETLEPPPCCRPFTKECQGISREQLRQAAKNIPAGTSFGVELELIFPDEAGGFQSVLQALQHAGLQGPWGVGVDYSIKYDRDSCTALEVISPPLQGLEGLLQVYQAMEALHVLRPGVNTSTGLHIHVGCDLARGWRFSHLKNLVCNCVMLEKALSQVMPLHRWQNPYCNSLRRCLPGVHHLDDVIRCLLTFPTTSCLASVINRPEVGKPESGKYYRVNLLAIEEHGTVEFRQPPGTTSPGLVVAYALLYLRLVEASKKTRASGEDWEDLMKLCSGDELLCNWLIRRREEIETVELEMRARANTEIQTSTV